MFKKLKSRKGFTLIELLVVFAITGIVMVVIIGIMSLGLNLFDRSNKTGSAHSMALLLTEKIEQEVKFADTVTVLAALPATPAAGTYYLYFNNDNTNPANTGLRRQTGATADFTYLGGSFRGLICAVTFKGSGAETLNLDISITDSNGNGIYHTNTDILINNITAQVLAANGSVLAYTMPTL